jgi:sugar phosphate permease
LPRGRRKPRIFYGWVVVAIAFITMAIAISARTSFSLLYPEILTEFSWSRGLTAGAYSLGFVASITLLPVVGVLMDRFGPRIVVPLGALLVTGGFIMLRTITDPIGLYVAMGLLIVNGSMAMSYIVHSMFLPRWFERNRGLAVGIAFSGVGVGALVLMPAFQWIIDARGWREASVVMGFLVAIGIIPLNLLFQRGAPAELGLEPDGRDPADTRAPAGRRDAARNKGEIIVDAAWAETDWTVARAVGTVRLWAICCAMFGALFVWYALQAHQTKFLIDVGFSPAFAATALGLVAFFGIFGQIGIGALSDRIGREFSWTLALAGFATASLLMIQITKTPSTGLVYAAMAAQGLFGYGMSALFGAITTEIFSGRKLASILAIVGVCGNIGAGTGAWLMGALHDMNGNYIVGFLACWAMSVASILCVWIASPASVRRVAGSRPKRRRSPRLATPQEP